MCRTLGQISVRKSGVPRFDQTKTNIDISSPSIGLADDNQPDEEFPDTTDTNNASLAIETIPNRGPLLTTALALFGSGSFIADRVARPTAYLYPNVTTGSWKQRQGDYTRYICVGRVPFVGLLRNQYGQAQAGNPLDDCLTNSALTHDDLQVQLEHYVRLFYWNVWDDLDGERVTNAFTAAAFLANEALLDNFALRESAWQVQYDLGADTTIPVISRTGVIVISTLTGVFLAALLALATYATSKPRWTDQLDSFAMLRIGASIPNDIQFRTTEQVQDIDALDRLPGWVGDATGGEGQRGLLALGGSGLLYQKRKFTIYDVDGKFGLPLPGKQT